MSVHSHRRALAIAAFLGVFMITATAVAVTGALTQPAGTAGCISTDGSGPCAQGHGFANGVDDVTVSPDGKSVYATTYGAVARFVRDKSTGAITQPAGAAGCVSEDGSGPCADGHALTGGADSVVVSPDGNSVYVASYVNNAVLRFKRNKSTGAITQPAGAAGCISEDGSGPCTDGHGLTGVSWVTISADGKSVYATSTISNAIVRFKRDKSTGAITQPAGAAGCISEDGGGPCADGHALLDPVWVVPSPDGKSLYVASLNSNAVAIFKRDKATGAMTQPAGTAGCVSENGSGPCADGRALVGPFSVAVSGNGKSVYVASSISNAVARFTRSHSGGLKQSSGSSGCVSEGGASSCTSGHGLTGADSVAVSADGKSVYATTDNGVAIFNRSKTTGVLTQPSGTAGCFSDDGSGPCADGRGLANAYVGAISADDKSLYVASIDSAAIARFKRKP